MDKDFLLSATCVLCSIVAGATIWKIVKKIRCSPESYDDILNESINKAISMLQSEKPGHESIVGNLLIVKRVREGQVVFCLIRRYDNGRTTSTVVSPTFNIAICPQSLQDELDKKNEVVIKKIEK